MDPESKKLLEDTLKLSQENNDILRSLRRSMRTQRLMSILYWTFIIGSAVGAYYIFQPYIEQIKNIYGGAGDLFENFQQ